MTNARCTVIVSSCDAYSDVWEPFFFILKKNWDIPYPVVLVTETKSFSVDGIDLETINLPAKKGVASTWSERLIFALKQIKTPYVIFLLEDFFMTGAVDQKRIEQCIKWLDDDKKAVCFSFYPTTGNEPSKYAGFERRPQNGLYRFNAQAGLWRTKQLLSFLDPAEDAWQWENEGNKRSFSINDDFYSISDRKPLIFQYDYMEHGLIGGKWFKNTKKLFESCGLKVDFEKRGFFDEKYKALLPSVKSSFILDDVLYIDKGRGFCEQDAAKSLGRSEDKNGEFHFEYEIPKDCSRLIRFDPSTRSGFAIKNLVIEVKYADKTTEIIEPFFYSTNGVEYKDLLVLLENDPYVSFYANRKKKELAVVISGEIVCPLNKEIIDCVYKKKRINIGFYIGKLR